MNATPTSIARLSAALLVAATLTGLPAMAQLSSAASAVVTTEQVRAELIAQAPDGAGPGNTVWVGLQLTHKPAWHTYWKNSGDSGLATQLVWSLPAGVSAGEIQWPLPQKIRIGTLANYGYEGTVLLPVPLTLSADFKPPLLSDTLDIKLAAAWLVCKTECIPEEGQFTLKLPIKSSSAGNSAAFDAAWRNAPEALAGTPGNSLVVDGKTIKLTVQGLPTAWQGRKLDFFPETPEVIETAADWTQGWHGDTWSAQVPLSAQRSASPQRMPVVLALDGQGRRVEMAVTGKWPQVSSAAPVSTALQAALGQGSNGGLRLGQPPAATLGFWACLLYTSPSPRD